ncbi:MAG: B12-binding radical protein [Anaerosolibacter sp.]|uniref:radical SAM protein n=1 Tax=Anaerosolibacter sp. TaxID=1872527 RepID=UPI0026118252|nr:radical SAM protein [Anaerosolibacter sp.]MDF2548439.1 B12-binding radical protein [Anaerosolibacter sp.]
MRYEGTVYRPPSEAYSLIVQVTIGCSHNQCTFCSMYKDKKFRIRQISEIIKDLEAARVHYKSIKRVFLADGNALVLKIEDLKTILKKINELFPECERVGIYSAPKDILRKTVEELKSLNELGLGIAYLGIESGSDEILKSIKKGVTAEEMIEAGRKIIRSGISLSTTIISGLGGVERWKEHAIESARVVNAINPQYLGLLTLLLEEETELYREVQDGTFQLLSPEEIMKETHLFIQQLQVKDCMLRSNHPSNYVSLQGILPQDQSKLLLHLEEALENGERYRDEFFRRL